MTQDSAAAVPDSGYLYLCWGSTEFFREAIESCRSLKRVSPDAHVTIAVSGTPAEMADEMEALFDSVVPMTASGEPDDRPLPPIGFDHSVKVRNIYRASPYKRTCFLDTDTYFLRSPEGGFDLLDHFDLAVAPAPGDLTPIHDSSGRVVRGFTPYNTGVIYFNREGTEQLFERWAALQEQAIVLELPDAGRDQPTFAAALLESGCRFSVLQTRWNVRMPFPERVAGEVIAVHAHDAELGGLDIAGAAARLDRSPNIRVWVPGVNEVIDLRMSVVRWAWVTAQGFRYFLWRDARRIGDFVYRRLLRPIFGRR